MSKRFIFPEQSGDRKKPRLDVSVSDHNFPLSQNAGFSNVADDFDEIDDELLLQASQACEQACNASVLPAYSQFTRPTLTSTQLPEPSSSGGLFSFKKPSMKASGAVSSLLKDKSNRISSPLRGIACSVSGIETIDLTDKYFNDKVLDNEDSDYVYRQLLILKEENAKLKSENGKLLEKCVIKEGEASILRTQLKTHQVMVDNARLEKIKTQEHTQLQWSYKLNTVKKKLCDMQTELETKNLEVISMKEKCKMLESNKIKLTQVTIAPNDMGRMNNSMFVTNNFLASGMKKPKTVSSTVQTDNSPQFLKLSKPCRLEKTNLTEILPLIMDSAKDQQYSILDYNEKLKKPTDYSPNKCRIFSGFYRFSSSTDGVDSVPKLKISLSSIYEDLAYIAACNNNVEKAQDQYINIFKATRTVLEYVHCQLEIVSKRLTSAFQKEMDKRYIEATTTFVVITEQDLITGKELFNEEQSILARRMVAVLKCVLSNAKAIQFFNKTQRPSGGASANDGTNQFMDLICRICTLLDNNSCGQLYSGFLLSVLLLVETLSDHSCHKSEMEIVRRVVTCRAAPPVPCRVLRALCSLGVAGSTLCTDGGNLRSDYEQGVLLYKKDSCLLQVLLTQVESSLECIERQRLVDEVVQTTGHLLQILVSCSSDQSDDQENSRCNCNHLLVQIIVYALRICAAALDGPGHPENEESLCTQQRALLSTCRGGLLALYQHSLRAPEFVASLGPAQGYLYEYCDRLQDYTHNEFYSTMLSELTATYLAADDAPSPLHRPAWLRSFETFAISD